MKWTADDYHRLPGAQRKEVDGWIEQHGLKSLMVIEVEQDGDVLLIRHAKSAAGEWCPLADDREEIVPFTTRMAIPAPPFPMGANA